jgi:hypothetical protein
MKKIIFITAAFLSTSAMAIAPADVVATEIITTNSDIRQFNGTDFGDLTEAQLKARLNADVSFKNKFLNVSNGKDRYSMSWGREGIENYSRFSNIFFNTKSKKIQTRSVTYTSGGLRSATRCEGSAVNAGFTDKEVYCATATKIVCDKVLAAYNKNDDARALAKKGSAEVAAKVSECTKTINSYSEILKSFANGFEDNKAVSQSREALVKVENEETKRLLKKLPEGGSLEMNSVNSPTSQKDFDQLQEKLTSSVQGLSQIHKMISLCEESIGKFDPNLGQNRADSSSTSSSSSVSGSVKGNK